MGKRETDHVDPAGPDLLAVADAEVRANGGEIVYRGPLRLDDARWPAEAARLHRGLRIRDASDPDPKGWVALVFPDGSVRLSSGIAAGHWFRTRDESGESAR